MDREVLIGRLRSLANDNQDVSSDIEVLEACRELLKDFDTTQPGKIADVLENTLEVEPEVQKTDDIGSRQPNQKELEELVEIVEEHKEKSEKELVEIAQKNPLLKKVSVGETIKRQLELMRKAQVKNVNPKKIDKVVKETLVTEARLRDKGIPEEKVEVLAEKIVEVAETSGTLEDGREKIGAALREIKVDKELRKEIIETTVLETAKEIIEEKVDEVVKGLTDELADFKLTAEQTEEIGTEVRKNIEVVVNDPTIQLNHYEVEEPGTNLTTKIGKILNEKASGKETAMGVAVRNAEVGLKQKIFTDNTNEDSPLDVVCEAKLEEEIITRMMGNGSTVEEAKSAAKMVGRLRFPPKESSNSAAEAKAMETLEKNGFHGGDNPRLAEQAGMIRNLIKSPVAVNKNIKNILGVADKLGGIKGFDQLKTVAKTLTENPKLMKSLELIQKFTKFQGTIDNIAGGIANPIGYLLKIPALQDFAMQLATRFGGETVGAMATQIAQFGLKDGITNIVGQLLRTGTVKIGTKVAADLATDAAVDATVDLGLAGTGVGIPIALILLVLQLGWELVKPILNWAKNKLENALEAIGIGSAKTKQYLQDQFGKLFGSLFYWGGLAATGLLSISAMMGVALVAAYAALNILVPGVLGGLLGLNWLTATTVAPLAAPKGTGASCVKISNPNSGGGDGNCNPNAPANDFSGMVSKAEFVSTAGRWKPGKNNAEKCFNDAVNRALCAGINPIYALRTWLFESGASNYSDGKPVADFGITSINKPNDFNVQIEAFLKLDPASVCLGTPKIGNDYWLAYATNFLTGDIGTACDPDKVASGITGRQYKKMMEDSFALVGGMPASIHVEAGGQSCNGGTETATSNNSYTYTDENGDTWLCENTTTENPETSYSYNPNAPGLIGVIVPGECSVSEKAILTKQCDPKWGSMSLNGGGTVCSAGCGPTSVSMMARIKNGDLTPPAIIFTQGSPYYSMGKNGSSLQQGQQELGKLFGAGAVEYDTVTKGCDEKAIAKWICDGKVVMVLANFYRNSNLDSGGHFVLAVAVNNGKIETYDPYYSTATPFDGTKAVGYIHDIKECLTVDKNGIK